MLLRTVLTVAAILAMPDVRRESEPPQAIRQRMRLLQGKGGVGVDLTKDIVVELEVLPKQRLTTRGIECLVRIRNDTDKPLIFRDPVDFLSVQLVDGRGFPVALPPVHSHYLINTKRGNARAKPQEVRQLYAEKAPFTLTGIEMDELGTKRDTDESLIQLAPRGHYAMKLTIRKIIADPEERARLLTSRPASQPADLNVPRPPLAVKPVPCGTYRLSVLLSLTVPDPGVSRAMFRSDAVTVSLMKAQGKHPSTQSSPPTTEK
jgi:hypothetical protein